MSNIKIPSIEDLPPVLVSTISEADQKGRLCPDAKNLFRAFYSCPPEQTKIVILGQDPYQTRGKASGLAFGYNKSYTGPIDSSLKNILDEIERSTGQRVEDRSLEHLPSQGVLLLNTRLSTEVDSVLAHKGLGWETIVASYLAALQDTYSGLVFMLWGREAQSYGYVVNPNKGHLVLETSHPCAYSAARGFIGCNHFKLANDYLSSLGKEEIIYGPEFKPAA